MPQPFEIDDYASSLFDGLSGFWQRFFRDTNDLHAFYRASEQLLGQVYLDLLGSVLSTGIVDTPVFNKEYWKLFLIQERDLSFVESQYISEDRYRYDMPGTAVSLFLMQNSIFNPSVTFEKDIDFDLKDDDGYVYFRRDIFNEVIDPNTGLLSPLSGVAWRMTEITVGNSLTDAALPVGSTWESSTEVKKGDILSLMAYRGVATGQQGTVGQIVTTGYPFFVGDVGTVFDDTNIGDIIEVYASGTGEYVGYYLILAAHETDTNLAYLDHTFNLPTVTSSADLKWNHYKAIYFDAPDEIYEIDYFDKEKIIGNYNTPFPLQYQYPLVYAVIRDVEDNNPPPVALSPVGYTDLLGDILSGDRSLVLIPGSIKVNALRRDGTIITEDTDNHKGEGFDYVVDYYRGRLTVLDPLGWSTLVAPTCNYSCRKQVLFSAGGRINELAYNQVREISLWVPEVMVDRYTLYNNYGYLLNRFSASSETYKAFLRGIMYLYVSGPKLYVVEAALNVAAGYPVIIADGEILTNYDSGINATGTDGVFTSGDQYLFSSASASFTNDDTGAWLDVTSVLNEANNNKFKIVAVVDSNTVEVEADFPVVDEISLDWVLSWTYQQTITTKTTRNEIRYYKYPVNVPVRTDLSDPSNYNRLAFEAFEILTTAFQVTDYIEDPQWWHDKYIPSVLWPNTTADRRFATTMLYANIINPMDDARIDDPGVFMDADDQGIVVAPTDPVDPEHPLVDIHRHNVAFCIMDQFLKFHMFFVDIDPTVDLTAQFRDDMANLVLIVKPSYTYPYVETGDVFIDNLMLFDIFSAEFGFEFTLDGIQFADCSLKLDQPYYMGDYYRYKFYDEASQGIASPPAVPFTLAVLTGERIVNCTIHATVDSVQVLEGIDYIIDFDPESLTHGLVTPLTTWDAAGNITFTARTVLIYNGGTPNTTLGFTPLMIDGLQPGYVRATIAAPYEKTEMVERALEVKIDTNYPSGVPYVYR